ncbi:MAG TPA: DUF1566 domain-containing protein [Rhodocyclaceae bacterium]|nr:DUF1566 domain-containing protein [Rhodocyclaceae bacterium]
MTVPRIRPPALILAVGCAALLAGGCAKKEPIEFKFQRVSAAGEPYQGNGEYAGQPWACILDVRTGLMWEVKTPEPGLHYAGNTYSWHYPPEAEMYTRGDNGKPNGGTCTGSGCDTWAFMNAVNEQGLCGFHDWRVPSREELGSIIDPRIKPPGPTLSVEYFPNTVSAEHWSSSAYRFHSPGAWAWGFENGLDRVDLKESAKHIRLVRGEVGEQPAPPRGPKY